MSDVRVVITGTGWVTPLGCDVPSVWKRMIAGDSGIAPVAQFPASSYPTNFAGESEDVNLDAILPNPKPHRHALRNVRFALAAAAQAWSQAGLSTHSLTNPRRFGMYLGSGEGPPDFGPFAEANLKSWKADSRSVDYANWAQSAQKLFTVHNEVGQEPNMSLAHLATAFGCQGPAYNCMTACAASTQALGEAFEIIRHGDADAMLTGGAHSMIHPLGMSGFIRLTAMSTRCDNPTTAARPFDATRDGFVMGEGAGMIVLESLQHALDRGATPLAEVAGYGSTADAYRITDMHPDGQGAASAMRMALKQAGIEPREPASDNRPPIDYISAHGTGTKENDSTESNAIHTVFGPQAHNLAVSSIKSMTGHLIQAAGAVELITCVQAIQTGWLPPTMNLSEPDVECDLDYIPNQARDLNANNGVEVCLSNSFGFGGQNDTVVIRKFHP